MINITLKAKHFYYILNFIKNNPMFQFISVVTRMKTIIDLDADLETQFTIAASPSEIGEIYKVLTQLPEGIANTINVEMDSLLQPQIVAGMTTEYQNNVPDNLAHWRNLANIITDIKIQNTAERERAIITGKSILVSI